MALALGGALGAAAFAAIRRDGGLPTYFKWKESMLVRVRDQGECNSCWAFSVSDMIADTINLRTGGKWGRRSLSAQYLIDCVPSYGCGVGGVPEDVYDLLASNGIPLESDYVNYSAKIGTCSPSKGAAFTEAGTGVDLCEDPAHKFPFNRDNIVEQNVNRMKRAIMHKGPIVGTVIARQDFFTYDARNGIYSADHRSPVRGGHAIEIIGWCDASVEWNEPGFDGAYWICRSSYGSGWGVPKGQNYGFAYVKMGCNESGIESRASVCDIKIPDGYTEVRDAWKTSAVVSYGDTVNDPERDEFMKKLH